MPHRYVKQDQMEKKYRSSKMIRSLSACDRKFVTMMMQSGVLLEEKKSGIHHRQSVSKPRQLVGHLPHQLLHDFKTSTISPLLLFR